MLYLILPPIIIITALVLLIYFFSRRYPSVEKEIAAHLRDPEVASAYDFRLFDKLKRFALYILEHLAQWFKVMSLRSYNALHNWTQSLREKKIQAAVKKAAMPPISEPVIELSHTDTPSPLAAPVISERSRPMVSRHITKPEALVKKRPVLQAEPVAPLKNQLEDILVERIAANPRDLEAYERLGEYYMEQGNVQDAKECYRQVLRLSPVHRLAKVKIRRLEKMLEEKSK